MYFSELTKEQIMLYKYNELVSLDCPNCKNKFSRQAKLLRHTNTRKRKEMFCCQKCVTDFQRKKKTSTICPACSKEFIPKYNSECCSRNCANSFRHANLEKNFCSLCKEEIYSKSKMCRKCHNANKLSESLNITLMELKIKYPKKSNYHSVVRDKARRVLTTKNTIKECYSCKYDKYVECCHIIPISSFSMSALLTEINDIDNLVWLCPNCHKEFDLGRLVL